MGIRTLFSPKQLSVEGGSSFSHHIRGFLVPAKMSGEMFCLQEWSTLFLTEA